jgi:hypothetical protein
MPRSKCPPEICPASCIGLARLARRAEVVLVLIDGERSVGALTTPRRAFPDGNALLLDSERIHRIRPPTTALR